MEKVSATQSRTAPAPETEFRRGVVSGASHRAQGRKASRHAPTSRKEVLPSRSEKEQARLNGSASSDRLTTKGALEVGAPPERQRTRDGSLVAEDAETAGLPDTGMRTAHPADEANSGRAAFATRMESLEFSDAHPVHRAGRSSEVDRTGSVTEFQGRFDLQSVRSLRVQLEQGVMLQLTQTSQNAAARVQSNGRPLDSRQREQLRHALAPHGFDLDDDRERKHGGLQND